MTSPPSLLPTANEVLGCLHCRSGMRSWDPAPHATLPDNSRSELEHFVFFFAPLHYSQVRWVFFWSGCWKDVWYSVRIALLRDIYNFSFSLSLFCRHEFSNLVNDKALVAHVRQRWVVVYNGPCQLVSYQSQHPQLHPHSSTPSVLLLCEIYLDNRWQ